MARVARVPPAPVYRALLRAVRQQLRVRPVAPERWGVTSASDPGREYEVWRRYGVYVCSCRASVTDCKHIALVRYQRGELPLDRIDGPERWALELATGGSPVDKSMDTTRERLHGQVDRIAHNLADARASATRLDCEYQVIYDAFLAAHADLLGRLKAARASVSEHEQALRSAAVELYQYNAWRHSINGEPDPSKKPHPAVSIRVTKGKLVCHYPEESAYEWAYAHRMALALDAAAFEQHMLAEPPAMRPTWFGVEVKDDTVTATIATNLVQALDLTEPSS